MDSVVKSKVDIFFETYPLKKYAKKKILIHPGDTVTHIYYITKGFVGEYDINSSGSEVVVNSFKPPAFFPMSFALNPSITNEYYFETTTAVTARPAPVGEVVKFLHDNPDVVYDLLQRVYRGSDGLLRRMAHLMGGRARNRLVFELLNAAYRFGANDGSSQIMIPFDESEFARRTGLSRETVSRTLRELKSDKLVQVTRRGITLTDIGRLEDMLGSDL